MQTQVKNANRKDEGGIGQKMIDHDDQRSDDIDELRYNMNHVKRGRFIIINNKTFDHMDERKGTDVDCKNLETIFRETLGFEVVVKNDLTRTQMLQSMFEESRLDHSKYDCFAVAVLTHGDEGILYGKDELIQIESFVSPIKNCKSLAGKPKLFFFQACRGIKFDAGVEMTVEPDATDGGSNVPSFPKQKEILLPLDADFLFSYSTVPGYFAWRNNVNGSWFVQALTKNLKDLAFANIDLVRILTRVNHQVAYEFESNVPGRRERHRKKEVPSIVSMLTKDLYFTQK